MFIVIEKDKWGITPLFKGTELECHKFLKKYGATPVSNGLWLYCSEHGVTSFKIEKEINYARS